MVDIDASQYGLGAVLIQEHEVKGDVADDEVRKEWLTIEHWSNTLIYVERNYSTTEKESESRTFRP